MMRTVTSLWLWAHDCDWVFGRFGVFNDADNGIVVVVAHDCDWRFGRFGVFHDADGDIDVLMSARLQPGIWALQGSAMILTVMSL